MRVLMVVEEGADIAGGHAIQAAETARALGDLGVEVDVAHGSAGDLYGFDIVHGFGVSRATLRRARRTGAAVVVSPIWWRYSRGDRTRRTHFTQSLRLASSIARRGFVETSRRVRATDEVAALTFESADLLLPNSHGEAAQIVSDLAVTTPMHVVPNAVDPSLFTPPEGDARRVGVAYVGRIEPHKNQLGLIEALRDSSIPLLIVGPDHPHHAAYAAECRRRAGANVEFHEGGPQRMIAEVYRRAAVHALPSWFETTGLVSLEAAAAGCAVVTTSRGHAQEYFGEYAVYCDPGVKGSIKAAVRLALEQGPHPGLRAEVLGRYTWAHAAEATLEAYRHALTSRHR